MKNNRCVVALSIIGVLVLTVVLFLGINKYKKQQTKVAEYKKIALQEQELEREQRDLERNSNFYEKLSYGFDTNILVLGNSIALSEGGTTETDWLISLMRKLEAKYDSYVCHKNMAYLYTGYDVGFTQIATLDDNRDYDAVIICYPACKDEVELIQYEAILSQVKKKYEKAAIIGVITNNNQIIDCTDTINLIEHYEGICVDMQSTFAETTDDLIDHEFYPNNAGYELYAQTVFDKIVDKVGKEIEISKEIDPVMLDINAYKNCVYVPLRKCRKFSEDTIVLDLENFSGKICIQSRWGTGKKAYDIYLDYGNWMLRNEFQYDVACWYDTFISHDISKANKEIMIQFTGDASLSEVKGFYLISGDPILLRE